MRQLMLFLIFAIGVRPAHAGETAADPYAKVLAPYVDELTFVAVRVDGTRLDLEALARQLAAMVGERGIAEGRAILEVVKATFVQSGGKEIFALQNWAHGIDEVLLVAPLGKGADGQAIAGILGQIPGFKAQAKEGVVLAGAARLLDKFKDFTSRPRPELTRALAAAGDGPLQAAALVPAPLERAIAELMPTVPKQFGGGSSRELVPHWLTADFTLGKTMSVKLVARVKSPDGAERALQVLDGLYLMLALDAQVKAFIPDIAKLTPALTPKAQGDRLILSLSEKEVRALAGPLLKKLIAK